jgi:tRNA-splicing ligase RtcB
MPTPERTDAAPLATWLATPMEAEAARVIERVRRADDVVHVAVMPDVHVAANVCVGTAMATRRLVYPAAVGGDIGCGMLAMRFDAGADIVRDPTNAGAILREIGRAVPAQRRHRQRTLPLPAELESEPLSHPSLQSVMNGDGRLQLGTLGGGNHFIELQSDAEDSDRLWLMIHSGSRAIGQAVKDHHLARATPHGGASLAALDTDTVAGAAYLHDQDWARRYAAANRAAMARQVVEVLKRLLQIEPVEGSTITCDHNHVQRETHFDGDPLLVHRKGAMPADAGQAGIIPGSMGTLSFHVEGCGCAAALRSSAHGAGRALSRRAAREHFTTADLRRQMRGIWFDPRLSEPLREESPRAYKDIRAVMRAQSELVKTIRTLRTQLVYKGG